MSDTIEQARRKLRDAIAGVEAMPLDENAFDYEIDALIAAVRAEAFEAGYDAAVSRETDVTLAEAWAAYLAARLRETPE